MALSTILLIVAAVTLLLVILGLDWVNTDEIAAVTLWMRVAAEVFFFKICAVQQSALMAIKTPCLIMALTAVVASLTGQYTVAAYKVGIMVRCYAFTFMAGVALFDLHFSVIGVGLFFVGVGLLL